MGVISELISLCRQWRAVWCRMCKCVHIPPLILVEFARLLQGIGRNSGSSITLNGVCFAVSLMRINNGSHGAVLTSNLSGESGHRLSQQAGERTYAASPLAFELDLEAR